MNNGTSSIVDLKTYKTQKNCEGSSFMLHLSLFCYKLYYFVSQDCLEDESESLAIQENTATPTEADDQTSVELSNGSAIPLVAFTEPRKEGDNSIEKTNDGCVEGCESFHPADLLSFAWQIARGMVRAKTATVHLFVYTKELRKNGNVTIAITTQFLRALQLVNLGSREYSTVRPD